MTDTPVHQPPNTVSSTMMWRFFQHLCWMIFRLLFDYQARGTHHLPKTGGVLLVSNHQSYLDPMILAMPLQRPMSFLAKSELFHNKYFGWLIRSLNAFPVKQGRGDSGAIKETLRRLKDGHVLNIYPEGTRTESGQIERIQRGAALVVRRAGVPILPAAIDGSFQAWPRNRKFPRPGVIRVLYGPPLVIDGMNDQEITDLIDRTLHDLFEQVAALRRSAMRKSGRRASTLEPRSTN